MTNNVICFLLAYEFLLGTVTQICYCHHFFLFFLFLCINPIFLLWLPYHLRLFRRIMDNIVSVLFLFIFTFILFWSFLSRLPSRIKISPVLNISVPSHYFQASLLHVIIFYSYSFDTSSQKDIPLKYINIYRCHFFETNKCFLRSFIKLYIHDMLTNQNQPLYTCIPKKLHYPPPPSFLVLICFFLIKYSRTLIYSEIRLPSFSFVEFCRCTKTKHSKKTLF